ncbi:MAG: hypothetical protein K9M57_08015, partial [Phycisphaerae bacterium]|nr:hypothetical protein [Phycisphaerae bacterium]
MNFEDKLKQKLEQLGSQVSSNHSIADAVMRQIEQGAAEPPRSHRIRNFVMKNLLTKYAAAAVVIIGIIIGASVFNVSPDGATIAWADVVKAVNQVRCVRFITEAKTNGQKVTGDIWIDFDKKTIIIKGVMNGVVNISRADGVNMVMEQYDPVTGDVHTMALPEQAAKMLLPQKDFLTFLLKMFSAGEMAEGVDDLQNWNKKNDLSANTTIFDIQTGNGGHDFEVVIIVDNATQRPIELKMSVKSSDSASISHQNCKFAYPDKVPSSFEEIGIKVKSEKQVTGDIDLSKCYHGQLVDLTGNPVVGKIIYGWGNIYSSDNQGNFAFEKPKSKDANKPGYIIATNKSNSLARIRVLRREDLGKAMEIVLEPLVTVKARVVGADGEILNNAKIKPTVEIFKKGDSSTSSEIYLGWKINIQESKPGVFTISNLPISENMKLNVERRGYYWKDFPLENMTSGKVNDIGDLKLELDSGYTKDTKFNRTLTGRIIDENGKPIRASSISARVTNEIVEGKFKWNGSYIIEGLPNTGSFAVWVYSDYGDSNVRITPETPNEYDIQVFPGGYELYGKKAPELKVDQWLNSEPVSIEKYRGKVVVLAVSIHDIRRESSIKKMEALFKKYQDKGLAVIAVHRNN